MAEEEEFVIAVGLHSVQPDDAVTAGGSEKQLVQCDDVLVQGNR
jgi:hypothetical protein